ncbi:hypothetical protein BC937DRAFT_93178 [Endogone sp. FLAS-F59071]|nr:hypothetical protein BC937DRAFT_93178 [Endogone sp. FLAS-F59071]|eukprot:RUS14895.1 hypothetical protein BC937DRAFT_93178 [Endogone sp. FLAS-F59071]
MSLTEWAVRIMNTPDAIEKVELTHHLAELWRSGQISTVGAVSPPDRPARPDSLEVISPGKAVKVGKGGSLVSTSITLRPIVSDGKLWVSLAICWALFHQ